MGIEENITLRPISTEDTDFMVRLACNLETTRYIPVLITERSMMETWIAGLGSNDHEFIVQAEDMLKCILRTTRMRSYFFL